MLPAALALILAVAGQDAAGITPALRDAILRHADPGVAFNRHYALSFVPCGIACGSYWLIDRRTRGILELPDESHANEMVADVRLRPDSDLLRMYYSDRDGLGPCRSRRYRMVGTRFQPVGAMITAPCPR